MLFGHQNDDTNQADQPVAEAVPGVNPLAVDSETGASLPVAPVSPAASDSDATDSNSSVLDQPLVDENDTSTAPVIDPPTPAALDTPPENQISTETEPSVLRTASQSSSTGSSAGSDDLLGLKQQALTQLSPLLNHLDQTPEEKFRTTMMLIQSTDNQALLKDAYEVAQAITDDKVRAQALLDVVNEINYFTQPKAS